MTSDLIARLTPKQLRMLESGVFHFDSGGDNADNLRQALALEQPGLIVMWETRYSQHAVWNCEVTRKGRAALKSRRPA